MVRSAASPSSNRSRAVLFGPILFQDPKTRRRERALIRSLRLSQSRDWLIGIDGGALVLEKLGLKPHWMVGDWDTLRDPKRLAERTGAQRVDLPQDKDRSDTDHAIELAKKLGARELLCLGLTGGRPDHHLAVLADLSRAADQFDRVSAHAVEGEYSFVSGGGHWRAGLKRGQLFSVFAIHGTAKGVTIRGAKYPLKNAVLKLSSQGLSNVALGGAMRPCEVRVDSGKLLIIVPDTGLSS